VETIWKRPFGKPRKDGKLIPHTNKEKLAVKMKNGC
jgi:hypothetical protein